ncbi:hypothetical protein RIF29_28962 [Crotalaria pallida]|uniref:F-box/LRR-repeat protein 15/At3g58940/PEG3-like LRR domain-containing protein n=1 Tax=Crotalaria pallida TaxID=3830 RepID=A0AAN9HVT8_CROPI
MIPSGVDIQQKEAVSLLNKYNFCFRVYWKLSSFLQKGLAIRTFKLIFESLPPPALFVFNDWMKLVCNSGVEELRLDNGLEHPKSFDSYDEFASLPLCVLEAKSLIKLQLTWHFRVDQAFLNHPIQFSSLQALSLEHVYLGDGQVIQKLIYSCPLIEKLELAWCYGVKSVSIHDLLKLKVVFIKGIEEIDVDAPSLENLHFRGLETFKAREKIKMHNCRNLRELYLADTSSIIITDQWLLELFQKCPLLEKLIIVSFDMTGLTAISSIQLKVLSLCNCYNCDYLEIDAPNLYKFEYHDDCCIMPLKILNSSSQLVLDVGLCFDYAYLHLEFLRDFLKEVKRQPIPVYLFLELAGYAGFEDDPRSVVPPSIIHLTLCVTSDDEDTCLCFVTNLLWCCRPSFISLRLNSKNTFVKIFCEKLISRKEGDCCSNSSQIICWWLEKPISRKEGDCCSNSSQIKCWWHFLKDVTVSHKAEGDLKSLLEAFPTLSSEEEEEINQAMLADVNFMLEWHS